MFREARQRVTYYPGARIAVISASLAAAAALVLPTTALASTAIGSAQGDQPCELSADSIQISSAGASYAIPSGGTLITDWFFQAGSSDTGSVNLLVWRPAGPGAYTLVGTTPTVNLSDPLSTFTLDTPLPVQAGDVIGLRLTGSTTCFSAANYDDTVGFSFSSASVGDTVLMNSAHDMQLNVRAAIYVASNPVVSSADQCKNGGWQTLTNGQGTAFRNQGDCVSFVRTGGKNPGNG